MAPFVVFLLPLENPLWVGVHWVDFIMFGVWTYDGEFIEYWKQSIEKSFKSKNNLGNLGAILILLESV
jgi:hypothetical protein